ncbi:MAG: extracellular solute-binding protein [Candidatus Pacebacteria bacterium]|nr:extracellular solute-binding protein [Candidatus Paceibacterota bacterium]
MKKFTKKQKIILGVIGGLFLIFLIAGNNFLDKNVKGEVSILGVGIDKDVIQLMTSNIKTDVGNIEVKYTEVSEEKYLEKLKNSFSLGEENYDIVMIKNDMLHDLKNYLEPFSISEEEVKRSYFDTVFRDFYIDGKLYAKPTYIDSLVLYYNRNILNKKGVFNVPVV